MEENPNSVYEEATITIISKRKSVKKLKINAKAIIFPKESSGSGAWENEIPEIVPVKLSYRKSSQPIGHGKFGTVFSAQIIDIRHGSSVNIFAMFFNMKTQCRKNKKFTLASKFLFDVLLAHI